MIGDPAGQIKPDASAVGSIGAGGAIPAGPVQQMEKPVGQAAKATVGDNTNRGVERGRAMPSGL